MISPDIVQQIFNAARIEEVVGDFVALKKRGTNLIGHCPFHNEKTPSFTVSQAKGIFKCFGCGKGGRAIDFVMEHEKLTYPEALKYLAQKYHIEIKEEVPSEEAIKQKDEIESLAALNLFAQQYFTQILWEHPEGQSIALSYIEHRNLNHDIVKRFQLGYCLNSHDAFTNHALKNGYKREYLIETGLCKEKDDRIFDRFFARLMFPIHSLSGRIIGFGGRILSNEKEVAKYLNSPESKIYHKREVLYGLYFAKKAIVSKDLCYLVEGYTDVISLFQAGIENVVASSGTSLTEEQIRLIRRFTSNVCILYDGDSAGIKASLRGIDLILKEGLNVKVVLFPEGEDPDSYCRNNSSSQVLAYIQANATDFIRFKTNVLLNEVKNDPVKKAGLIRDIVESIALIPDQIKRSVYIADCSKQLEINEQVLYNELNKIRRQLLEKEKYVPQTSTELVIPNIAEKQIEPDYFNYEPLEKEIIQLLLQFHHQQTTIRTLDEEGFPIEYNVSIPQFIIDELAKDLIGFTNQLYQKVFNIFIQQIQNEEPINDSLFLDNEDEQIRRLTIDLTQSPYTLSENWEKMHRITVPDQLSMLERHVYASICALKLRKIDEMIEKETQKLSEAFETEAYTVTMLNIKEYQKIKVAIAKVLDRVVLK